MNLSHWLRLRYKGIINSIAFLPAIMIILSLLLAWVMLRFDFSESGKHIKATSAFLTLKDASTARSIISSIVGGVISLTVFSFSMVMIILNQAASQLTNRVLNKLIENRFQQIVLGFYIGTIVYALFLLSAIRDTDNGIRVPALSTYLLMALTVTDIFFFIYFLHYITQSIKYDSIIEKVSTQTLAAMKKENLGSEKLAMNVPEGGIKIYSPEAGIFQDFEKIPLLKKIKKLHAVLYFLQVKGSYVLKQTPLLVIHHVSELSKDDYAGIQNTIIIQKGEDISGNDFYGFRQLKEIALKALSPGINDPGTAVLSLQALTGLLAYRLEHEPTCNFYDDDNVLRIILPQLTFDELFTSCILPLWDYGDKDRTLQHSFIQTLTKLQEVKPTSIVEELLKKIKLASYKS